MLTEEYLKNHFITAYYVDNDRKMIEVQCSNDDSSQIIPYVIEQDENHPYFQALMKFISVDELLNITHDRKKIERKHYERQVLKIARKEGLIFDAKDYLNKVQKSSEQISIILKFFLSYFFNDKFDKEKNKDLLFALKLEIFEYDVIKNSDYSKYKSLIRKAQTPYEIMKYVIEIIEYENNKKNTSQET
jgi:hypothetical protein